MIKLNRKDLALPAVFNNVRLGDLLHVGVAADHIYSSKDRRSSDRYVLLRSVPMRKGWTLYTKGVKRMSVPDSATLTPDYTQIGLFVPREITMATYGGPRELTIIHVVATHSTATRKLGAYYDPDRFTKAKVPM